MNGTLSPESNHTIEVPLPCLLPVTSLRDVRCSAMTLSAASFCPIRVPTSRISFHTFSHVASADGVPLGHPKGLIYVAIPCFFNSSRVPTALSVKALEYEVHRQIGFGRQEGLLGRVLFGEHLD